MPIPATLLRKLLSVPALLLAASASNITSAQEFTNHIGMIFVNIPAGSFYMGSCKQSDANTEENKKRAFLGQPLLGVVCPSGAAIDPDATVHETPQHRVQVGAFQLGKFEVTLKSFKQFIAATGKTDLVTQNFMENNPNGDNAPVSTVNWNDAQDFVAWLNQTKPAADRGVYRLPSEAEWEYAARAGSTTVYSFGDDPAQLGDYAWYSGNVESKGYKYAQPGTLKPNDFGLHNMHGNVLEWTQDCCNPSYQGAPINGKAWEAGDCSRRVLRGGSWIIDANGLRSAGRDDFDAGHRSRSFGFRVARTLP